MLNNSKIISQTASVTICFENYQILKKTSPKFKKKLSTLKMNKILSFIVCLITVNLVNSLQYHVQLDMGPEEFPRVPGSLFLHSSSKLDDSIRENLLKKT